MRYSQQYASYSDLRPLVDAAAAQVAPPPEPARLVGINEGKEGYLEL
jgi:hypothetical protein